MKAWLFQDARQKAKHGESKCPWSVGWYDANGNRKQKRAGSKSMAEKFRRKKEGELANGLCRIGPERIAWVKFREEYTTTIMKKWRSPASRTDANRALDVFEQLARPKYVDRIDSKTLDRFVAGRLSMRGKKKGDELSPETVKKELRTIRAALNVAKRWEYLSDVPEMPSVDGFGKDKPFVTEEHFDTMMQHCDAANLPSDQHFTAEQFWQALLAVAWVTGMRKSALMAVLWDDVDLESGIILSRYRDNKAKNDQRHKIPAVVPLLRRLHEVRKPGESRVFPWNHATKSLDRDFARIQKAAGIHLPCREDHEHTPSCHLYGFHGLRYAHATYNFGRVTDRELQGQMGHSSFNTTLRYIKYAEAHQERAYDAYLPQSLKQQAN